MVDEIRCFLFCTLFVSISALSDTYYGDKSLHVSLTSREDWQNVEAILNAYTRKEDVDVWKHPNNKGDANLLVKGYAYDDVTSALEQRGILYDVTISNVGEFLNGIDEAIAGWNAPYDNSIVGTYADYNQTLAWFEELKTEYPQLVTTVDIGLTYEGRPHRLLKLSTGVGSGKWNVYVEGGMHAREWIAPTTVNYITDQLIQGYVNGTQEIVQWFDLLDWYILPVANPDGYEYTHTTDRLWRKNRRPNAGSSCVGSDLNRNWAYQWGGVGSDPEPCSNTYRGPNPESEVEVQNVVNFIMPQAENFILYMAYHCWGQQFFTRWDYSDDPAVLPPDHAELMGLGILDLAERAVEAIVAVHDVFYEAGMAPDLMYAFSGSSADWARGVADIKYPYLEELRDNGTYSFVLPPEQIIPTGEENWAGFQVVIREIEEKCSGVPPPGPCNP